MKRVLLCGEGPGELGKDGRHEGVLRALIDRLGIAWERVDAVPYKRIRKFRSGQHGAAETRNLRALALMASERGCDAVIFSRDRDANRSKKSQRAASQREIDIERGVMLARAQFASLTIGGGMAVECLEGWMLCLVGDRDGEARSKHQAKTAAANRDIGTSERLTGIARTADLALAGPSLKAWLESVRAALHP